MWVLLRLIVIPLSVVTLFFLFLCLGFYLYLRLYKKMKPIKGEHYRVKVPSILKRIFYLTPLQMMKDRLRRDPEYFRYQGIIIFEGRQGNGKTISMVEQCRRYQLEYPKSYCLSNLKYKYEDQSMKSWDDLIDFKNPHGDRCGVIVLNDELQNTFNSKLSKDFPMEYLSIVTQNRKNRRVLLGTSQNFYMLSKDIRSQCTELRKCNTFFGCLTVVRRYEPEINSSGEVEKLKPRGMYFFVHSDELRESYDTYEVIKKMRKSGFKPRSEQASAFSDKPSPEIIVEQK